MRKSKRSRQRAAAVKGIPQLKRRKFLWRRNCNSVMSHLILIVFQSCMFKVNMTSKKAGMEGEMKNLEESRRLAK